MSYYITKEKVTEEKGIQTGGDDLNLHEELQLDGHELRSHAKSFYYVKDGKVSAKVCTKCKNTKLASDFHNNKTSIGGIRSNCKSCTSADQKDYSARNQERIKQYRRDYNEANSEQLKEKSSSWYYSNKGKANVLRKQWISKNKERYVVYKKRWYSENKESLALKERIRYDLNRDEKIAYSSQYAKDNPEIVRAAGIRRAARKKGLPDTLTSAEITKIKEHFDNRCSLSEEKQNIQLDHVIPISIGHGGTTYANIIPLKSNLNNSKHQNHIFEWFDNNKDRYGLSQNKFNNLIEYLAEINNMTTKEYRMYIDWCHDNPIEFSDIKRNGDEE